MSWRTVIPRTWLALLALCLLYTGQQLLSENRFDTDILALMPDAGTPFQAGSSNAGLERQFTVLVQHADQQQGLALASTLQQQLANQPGVETIQSGSPLSALAEFYRPYRYQLLTPAWRERLRTTDPDTLAQTALTELHSPVAMPRLYPLQADPFNLGGAWLQQLWPQSERFVPGELPAVSDNGKLWYLVRGQVSGSPFSLAVHDAVIGVVETFRHQHRDARMLTSGLVFHAAASASLSRHEISTVGIGSLVGILVLVIAALRSGRALLAIGFVLAGSVILALATTLMVFGRVHLITLAFGTTLLGLAVDYCFHFLIKYRRTGSASATGRLITRGLLLSLGSSLLAYGAQLFSPFPGLWQFAVFVSAGLLGAGAGVAVLACVYRDPGLSNRPTGWLFNRMAAPCFYRLARHRWSLGLVTVTALALLTILILSRPGADDIRLLNTSPIQLLNQEQQVQQLLNLPDTQRYWKVRGNGEQQRLARTEQVADNLGAPALSLSLLTPSLIRQQQDHNLIQDKLYGKDGALVRLCQRLATDCTDWPKPGAVKPGLNPGNLPETVSTLFPTLFPDGQPSYRIHPYTGYQYPPISSDTDVQTLNQVESFTRLLASFRLEVSRLFTAFFALFVVLCIALYHRQALAMVATVSLALLAGLALSSTGGINLFHILALLLVTGIAADTVIFYRELGLNADTWMASTLSMFTSVLAFGLLALSQVPVLHHFGSVVFFGLLTTWIVAPVLHCLDDQSDRHEIQTHG